MSRDQIIAEIELIRVLSKCEGYVSKLANNQAQQGLPSPHKVLAYLDYCQAQLDSLAGKGDATWLAQQQRTIQQLQSLLEDLIAIQQNEEGRFFAGCQYDERFDCLATSNEYFAKEKQVVQRIQLGNQQERAQLLGEHQPDIDTRLAEELTATLLANTQHLKRNARLQQQIIQNDIDSIGGTVGQMQQQQSRLKKARQGVERLRKQMASCWSCNGMWCQLLLICITILVFIWTYGFIRLGPDFRKSIVAVTQTVTQNVVTPTQQAKSQNITVQ